MKRIYLILAAIALFAAATATAATSGRAAEPTAPSFPGGEANFTAFVDSVMVYPPEAASLEIEGVVEVSFIVEPDGSHSGYRIVRPIDPYLEKEALRIAGLMPRWIPAEADGIPVEASASIRVIFRLPEE